MGSYRIVCKYVISPKYRLGRESLRRNRSFRRTPLTPPTADGTELGLVTLGIFSSCLYAFLLKRANAAKEAEIARQEALPESQRRVYTVQELQDLGDKSVEFKYISECTVNVTPSDDTDCLPSFIGAV